MTELIRKSDALAAIAAEGLHILDKAIAALPAVARVYDLDPATYAPVDDSQPPDPAVKAPDPAAIREAALREAEKALRDWQDSLNAHRFPDTAITVGMSADVVLALVAKGAAE